MDITSMQPWKQVEISCVVYTHTHTHHLTSMPNTFMKFSLISQWFVDWRSRSFFHSTSLIYAMLGTKDCDKEGDWIIPTRIPSSAVEHRPVPQWPGDTPAGEKGWSEGSEGSKKGVERDEKVSQRWDILRGGESSGRGNSMGLEPKLESTGHVWATSSKACDPVWGRKKNASARDIHLPIPRTWDYVTLCGKGELRLQMKLRSLISWLWNRLSWSVWVGLV